MNESSTSTSSIVELLERIEDTIDNNHKDVKEDIKKVNQKLDKIDKRITTLEIKQVTLIVKVEGIDKMLQNLENASYLLLSSLFHCCKRRLLHLTVLIRTAQPAQL